MSSECDATSLPEVGPHATPYNYIPKGVFSFPWISYDMIEVLPVTKCPMGSN